MGPRTQHGIIVYMDLRRMIDSVPYWYHEFEFAPGFVTVGERSSRAVLAELNLPLDMRGLRVLDIGARDGFFSFECERRGAAEVVPVDYIPAERTGFPVAKQILGSRLNLVHENIYNLAPEKYGQFDIVLMLGLLYHLPDPMRALDIVFHLMKLRARLLMETIIIDDELPSEMARRPFMLFYPRATKNADPTNYWGMTEACALSLLEENNLHVIAHSREAERGIFDAIKSAEGRDYYGEIARGLVR
ncbi:MAG: methyltransferase domain-containing protein [Candidatus Korobacteraceae bacterium]